MGSEDQMGAKGLGYWRETAIAIGAFAGWIGLAILLEKVTGYDGVRLTGYGFLAAGLGLMVWGWWRAPQPNRLTIGFLIAGLGVFSIFGKH